MQNNNGINNRFLASVSEAAAQQEREQRMYAVGLFNSTAQKIYCDLIAAEAQRAMADADDTGFSMNFEMPAKVAVQAAECFLVAVGMLRPKQKPAED